MSTIVYILGGIVVVILVFIVIKIRKKNEYSNYYAGNSDNFVDRAKSRAGKMLSCCFKFLRGGA